MIFIPKSLLRNSISFSPFQEFTDGEFQEVIDDPAPPNSVKRIFLCTGKIYYELLLERKKTPDAAIIRIEQLYPLHIEKIEAIFAKYKEATECVWVQEEPENMGAWEFMHPYLYDLLPKAMKLRYVGRGRSGAPATGSRKKHLEEQASILNALKRPL